MRETIILEVSSQSIEGQEESWKNYLTRQLITSIQKNKETKLKKEEKEKSIPFSEETPISTFLNSFIDGQDESWKNYLSRTLIKSEKKRNKKSYENKSKTEWYEEKKEKDLLLVILSTAGYLFGKDFALKNSVDYDQFANAYNDIFNKIGLQPDANFFRWQMADFFSAAWYASIVDFALVHFAQNGVFGEKTEWMEKNSKLTTCFTLSVLFSAYEAIQANQNNSFVDIHDLSAYLAGFLFFLSSEKIFQEYQIFKKQYGDKNISNFYANRGKEIGKSYLDTMKKAKEIVTTITENYTYPSS